MKINLTVISNYVKKKKKQTLKFGTKLNEIPGRWEK